MLDSEGTPLASWALPCPAWGIAITPDGTKLFATCTASGLVLAISPTDGSILTTINVGGQPRRVSFTTDGKLAIVANETLGVQFIR